MSHRVEALADRHELASFASGNTRRAAGGRLIVVDAIDDAAAGFYLARDFAPLPEHPRRLVMKLSSATAALELPWP